MLYGALLKEAKQTVSFGVAASLMDHCLRETASIIYRGTEIRNFPFGDTDFHRTIPLAVNSLISHTQHPDRDPTVSSWKIIK